MFVSHLLAAASDGGDSIFDLTDNLSISAVASMKNVSYAVATGIILLVAFVAKSLVKVAIAAFTAGCILVAVYNPGAFKELIENTAPALKGLEVSRTVDGVPGSQVLSPRGVGGA